MEIPNEPTEVALEPTNELNDVIAEVSPAMEDGQVVKVVQIAAEVAEPVLEPDAAMEPAEAVIATDEAPSDVQMDISNAVLDSEVAPNEPQQEPATDDFTIPLSTRVLLSRDSALNATEAQVETGFVELEDAEEGVPPEFTIDTVREEINLKLSYRRADEEDAMEGVKPANGQGKAEESSDSSDSDSEDEAEEEGGDPETTPDSDYNSQASSSSSDDENGDDLLPSLRMTLEEREKILQAMDAMGGDDEDGTPSAGVLKTKNEMDLPPVEPLPISQIPEDMELEEVGTVHSLVKELVIIEAKVSGDYRVLDEDTILCFGDRNVLGRVFDTFGPVSRPMYSIRFNTPTDIPSTSTVGTPIFYAPSMATYIFTKALRGKGSDASNKFDEEVDDDEREFSDDEAEMEYKRAAKARKRGGGAAAQMPRPDGEEMEDGEREMLSRSDRGRGRGRGRGAPGQQRGRPIAQPRAPRGGYAAQNNGYGGRSDGFDDYEPNARPSSQSYGAWQGRSMNGGTYYSAQGGYPSQQQQQGGPNDGAGALQNILGALSAQQGGYPPQGTGQGQWYPQQQQQPQQNYGQQPATYYGQPGQQAYGQGQPMYYHYGQQQGQAQGQQPNPFNYSPESFGRGNGQQGGGYRGGFQGGRGRGS